LAFFKVDEDDDSEFDDIEFDDDDDSEFDDDDDDDEDVMKLELVTVVAQIEPLPREFRDVSLISSIFHSIS